MFLVFTNNMKTVITRHSTSDCLKSTRCEVSTYHIHYAWYPIYYIQSQRLRLDLADGLTQIIPSSDYYGLDMDVMGRYFTHHWLLLDNLKFWLKPETSPANLKYILEELHTYCFQLDILYRLSSGLLVTKTYLKCKIDKNIRKMQDWQKHT